MKAQDDKTQRSLFKIPLDQLLDSKNSLRSLADNIDWPAIEVAFSGCYCLKLGRPGKEIRLMVGLHYLKAMFGESDETVLRKWVENPYWQYFCGEEEFQHDLPLKRTTLVKWRKKVKEKNYEKLLEETIKSGLKLKVVKKTELKKVNVDTTVMEKAIAFPTDIRLCHKMRDKLVKEANRVDIPLRQSYVRTSKKALFKYSRYRHAGQMKRAKKELKKVKNYLGRVLRDIRRQIDPKDMDHLVLSELVMLGERLFNQKKDSKNKIYALHTPEVECIAKGKAHKKYEFGCKIGIITTSKSNFILGCEAYHGNPYDGHTLKSALDQAKRFVRADAIKEVYAVGYRGHKINSPAVTVVNWKKKRISQSARKWMKRRSAIEPVIGHMKNDNGPKKNHLLGKSGDKLNAILMASGFNLRKMLRALDNRTNYLFCSFLEILRVFRLLRVKYLVGI